MNNNRTFVDEFKQEDEQQLPIIYNHVAFIDLPKYIYCIAQVGKIIYIICFCFKA